MRYVAFRRSLYRKLKAAIKLICFGSALLYALSLVRLGNESDAFQHTEDRNGDDNNIMFRLKLERSPNVMHLVRRLENCITSICEHSSVALTFHIIADELGIRSATDIFQRVRKVCKSGLSVEYYDLEEVIPKVMTQITAIRDAILSPKGKERRGAHFFLSNVMDEVLPQNIGRVISIDIDFFFQSDIKQLFDLFQNFKPTTIFGLAKEQNLFCRREFPQYRAQRPNTKLGNPPPDGEPGLNGGLILVDLNNMRNSVLYKQLLFDNAMKTYADKYMHKGEYSQISYILLYMEHPELFYVVPCSWNRQLAPHSRSQTTKEPGFDELYPLFHKCEGPIHAFHGNGNTRMPNEI